MFSVAYQEVCYFLVQDVYTKNGEKFGVVAYGNKEDMDSAMRALDGTPCKGKTVRLYPVIAVNNIKFGIQVTYWQTLTTDGLHFFPVADCHMCESAIAEPLNFIQIKVICLIASIGERRIFRRRRWQWHWWWRRRGLVPR